MGSIAPQRSAPVKLRTGSQTARRGGEARAICAPARAPGTGVVTRSSSTKNLPRQLLQPHVELPMCEPISLAPEEAASLKNMAARRDLSSGGSSVQCSPLRAPRVQDDAGAKQPMHRLGEGFSGPRSVSTATTHIIHDGINTGGDCASLQKHSYLQGVRVVFRRPPERTHAFQHLYT